MTEPRPYTHVRYSDATKARAVERWLAGESLYAITRDIGCEYGTVRLWLRQAGVEAARVSEVGRVRLARRQADEDRAAQGARAIPPEGDDEPIGSPVPQAPGRNARLDWSDHVRLGATLTLTISDDGEGGRVAIARYRERAGSHADRQGAYSERFSDQQETFELEHRASWPDRLLSILMRATSPDGATDERGRRRE